MHKLVITPLKDHLSKLFIKEYEENGAVQTLVENIKYARTKPASDLGVRVGFSPFYIISTFTSLVGCINSKFRCRLCSPGKTCITYLRRSEEDIRSLSKSADGGFAARKIRILTVGHRYYFPFGKYVTLRYSEHLIVICSTKT